MGPAAKDQLAQNCTSGWMTSIFAMNGFYQLSAAIECWSIAHTCMAKVFCAQSGRPLRDKRRPRLLKCRAGDDSFGCFLFPRRSSTYRVLAFGNLDAGWIITPCGASVHPRAARFVSLRRFPPWVPRVLPRLTR